MNTFSSNEILNTKPNVTNITIDELNSDNFLFMLDNWLVQIQKN